MDWFMSPRRRFSSSSGVSAGAGAGAGTLSVLESGCVPPPAAPLAGTCFATASVNLRASAPLMRARSVWPCARRGDRCGERAFGRVSTYPEQEEGRDTLDFERLGDLRLLFGFDL